MWIISYLEKIIEHPEEMKKVKKIFLYLGVALVVIDIIIHIPQLHLVHIYFFWDWIPGFSSLYGLLSTYLIIVISKWIGHELLMKPEDYYND